MQLFAADDIFRCIFVNALRFKVYCKLSYEIGTHNRQPTTICSERIAQYTVFLAIRYSCEKKVRKKAKIRNQYNQVPHLTQYTLWEIDKSTRKRHIQKCLEVSPFAAGDHKSARHKQGNMSKRNTKKIHKRSQVHTYLYTKTHVRTTWRHLYSFLSYLL